MAVTVSGRILVRWDKSPRQLHRLSAFRLRPRRSQICWVIRIGSKAPPLATLRLEPLPTGHEFREPTNLVQMHNGRLLVTEQDGRIWTLEPTGSAGYAATEFLDITDRVRSRGSEEGLLGLALDPANDARLYVYYSASSPRRSIVSRFKLVDDHSRADPDSELVILEVEQPYANHNGGQIAFGPEGYLYIGLGDGGSAGDPLGSGQDTSTAPRCHPAH